MYRNHELIAQTHASRQVRHAPEDPRRPPLELVGLALVDGGPAAQVGHGAPVAEHEARLGVKVVLVEAAAQPYRLLAGDLRSCRQAHAFYRGAVAHGVDVW